MAKKDRRFKYESDTERPVTISLRIPQALYERLERYAREHRQTVSELARDGIEMRLEVEADPRSRSAGSTTDEDMQATLARHDTQMQAIMLAIEHLQTTPAGNRWTSGITIIKQARNSEEPAQREAGEPARGSVSMDTMPASDVALSYQEASYTEVATLTDELTPESTIPATVPAFDTSKFYLGKLCPKGHDFGGTGLSLLRKHNQRCRECDNENKRARRQAKRQEVSA